MRPLAESERERIAQLMMWLEESDSGMLELPAIPSHYTELDKNDIWILLDGLERLLKGEGE